MGVIARAYKDVADYQTTLLLLDVCYLIAASDGHISTQEQHELRFLAETLKINPEEHERIKYKYSGYRGDHHHSTGESLHPKNDDYAALGIDRKATSEEVKKAYKQMAAQYHPDKVAHLGPELVEFANKKFNEISKAYTSIKKARGI
jgi:DnaJ like chaperone protein